LCRFGEEGGLVVEMKIIRRNEMMLHESITNRLTRRLVDLEIGEPVRDQVGLVEAIVVVVGNAS
jgi:hypothetical protein